MRRIVPVAVQHRIGSLAAEHDMRNIGQHNFEYCERAKREREAVRLKGTEHDATHACANQQREDIETHCQSWTLAGE